MAHVMDIAIVLSFDIARIDVLQNTKSVPSASPTDGQAVGRVAGERPEIDRIINIFSVIGSFSLFAHGADYCPKRDVSTFDR